MPYKSKLGKKDIAHLEQVLKFLKQEEKLCIDNTGLVDIVRKNRIEKQIVALSKVLYK